MEAAAAAENNKGILYQSPHRKSRPVGILIKAIYGVVGMRCAIILLNKAK